MPAAFEYVDSRSNQTQDGRLTHTRTFKAEASPDQMATVTGLPALGDPLPYNNPGNLIIAYLIAVDYEDGSRSASKIVVYYSNDPPTWGGSNPADPFFKSWTLSYFRVAQPIPYAVRGRPLFYVNAQTNTTEQLITYPILGTSFWESRKKFIRRTRVIGFGNPANWEAVGNQNNKLHKIYNKWYLFSVGDIQEVARNTWDLTYTWEFDAGTPELGVLHPDILFPSGLQCLPGGMYPGVFFARPPFHDIVSIPAVVGTPPAPTWPIFTQVCPYEVFENGYTLLPGFTL